MLTRPTVADEPAPGRGRGRGRGRTFWVQNAAPGDALGPEKRLGPEPTCRRSAAAARRSPTDCRAERVGGEADADTAPRNMGPSLTFESGSRGYRSTMLILGVILLLVGFLLGIPILGTLGVILAIVGAVLWILGGVGRPVAGRRHYY